MKGFWADFKKFITKGNIIDLAVAVVVGGAFNKIVTGLVSCIIMPLVGLAMGGWNVKDMKVVLTPAEIDQVTGEILTPANELLYGEFIQLIIDFLIIAFCIFVALRIMMKSKEKLNAAEIAAAKQKADEEAAAKKAADEAAKAAADAEIAKQKAEDAEKLQLLREIRDSLKK